MKRALIVLAMVLIAATSYNQTSRRTASANGSATRNSEGTTENNSRSNTSTTTSSSTSTRTSEEQKNNQNQNRDANNSNNQTQTRRSTDNGQGNSSRSNSNYNSNSNHNNDQNRNNNYSSHNRYNESAHSHHHSSDVYTSYPSSRVYHGTHVVSHAYREAPYDRNYRATHYVYREPTYVNIYWTRDMHRHYIEMYPEIRYWHYNIGYRINSTSAYYADYYVGEVMNVYGKVTDVYYSYQTDEFFLYFGAYYPYHDFTIVLPGNIARRYNQAPERYFNNQYISATGLITAFEGKPEIVVKRNFQLDVY